MTDMSRSMTMAAATGVMALMAGAAGGDSYDVLLNNPRVTSAIESNPFIEPGAYLDFLRMKINQLETGQTGSWDDYRHPEPHTDQEIAEVILQKVALSLYVEINELVPWSLLDYDDENLHIVLGDAYSELREPPFWKDRILFNLNPLVSFAYAQALRTLYPDDPIDSPQDLLDTTIIKMRDDGWLHRGFNFSYADAYAEIGYFESFIDFECLDLTRKGTSALPPRFIYSILHAQNVPSRLVFWFSHGGIEFPSLGLGMDGDVVYSALEAGILLRPNFLPVDLSYLELSLFEKWMAMERCEGISLRINQDVLQYLTLFDDPAWNADVLESFCHRTKFYPAPGDFLQRNFVDGSLSIVCQNDDPDAEDYQAPALTDEQFDEWFAAIAEFTPECAACTVDADCDDGELCNGQEYCDQFGYCDVWFPLTCDDGLLCTYDRCEDSACVFPPALYGDVNSDEVVDLTDILCVLDGFADGVTSPRPLDGRGASFLRPSDTGAMPQKNPGSGAEPHGTLHTPTDSAEEPFFC